MNAADRDRLRAQVSDSRRTIMHTDRLLHRIESLKDEVRRERAAREKAERNACRFHAMLLAERIKHLPTHTNALARSTFPGSASEGSQETS